MEASVRTQLPSYLLVVDDRAYGERLVRGLMYAGHEDVTLVRTRAEALHAVAERAPDRAVVDLAFGEPLGGLDVVADLCSARPQLPVVVLTDFPSVEVFRLVANAGARDLVMRTDNLGLITNAFVRDLADTGLRALPRVPPTLEQVEWEYISRVLTLVNGHTTLAAQLLGISRSTLHRKLAKNPGVNANVQRLRAEADKRPGRDAAASGARRKI